MKQSILLAALLVLLVPARSGHADTPGPHPFVRGSAQQLRNAHKGEAIVVHFWGLTCGPCLAELPKWTAERKARPDLRLVLVDSSPFGDKPSQVQAALKKAGLATAENWLFADSFEERLQYEVDPHWQGEMPYTLLIGRDGKTRAVSGLMDFAKLDQWLDQQSGKRS